MPALKNNAVLELVRGIKAYLVFEAGLTRGEVPDGETSDGEAPDGGELARVREQSEERGRRLAESERQVERLRGLLSAGDGEDGGVDAASMVWIFGSGRTGSTWLSAMMGDLPDHGLWDEPLVGKLFGDLYQSLRQDRREDRDFILGGSGEERRTSIRRFVLRETGLRFPDAVGEGRYLVVKEPNGSVGAPLLMEAMPESRMIFLIRDLRDSVASFMDAHKRGGWVYEKRDERGKAALDDKPENLNLLRRRVRTVAQEVGIARDAYGAHDGPKALVRYENLRADALGAMKRMYTDLGIDADETELARVVEKHSWDNVPADEKGQGKFKRKATPGSWREDLSPQQARIVEESLSPLIEEFYG